MLTFKIHTYINKERMNLINMSQRNESIVICIKEKYIAYNNNKKTEYFFINIIKRNAITIKNKYSLYIIYKHTQRDRQN